MKSTQCVILSMLLLAAPMPSMGSLSRAQARTYLTVSAGNVVRRQSVISFELPADLNKASYELRDETDKTLPLQVDADRRAWFILPKLAAGAEKRFRIEESRRSRGGPALSVVESEGKLRFSLGKRPVFTYNAQPGAMPRPDIREIFRRGAYIHPVYTPAGRVITDDYPPDHPHHHGIWFAWTKTEFQGRHPDFWNMGDGTGRVEFVGMDSTWGGPVQAGFKSRHRYVDLSGPEPVTALDEQWEVVVYAVGSGEKPYSMFDMICTQSCATSSPLILPEYRYGGVGFRGHRDWLPKNNCVFLTSEGKDRSNGHATRARWCHVGGEIAGELTGIAILCHPDNFRAPQAMRINPDQPFFCYSPSLSGDWEITPGKSYVSRYRFVVYDGPADTAELDRLWNDYATPPVVTISKR